MSVNLEIGTLSDLQDERVQRYFDHLSRGSIVEGAKLKINRVPAVFRCNRCQQSFEVDSLLENDLSCTQCHSRAVTLVSGREYHMQLKEVRRITYASNSDTGPFTDFTLEIDARLVSGTEHTDYGITFRRQCRGNFYFFTVSPDGTFTVGKQVKNEWYPLETGKSAFIKGDNSTNSLKVICDGPEAQIFVNENCIRTIADDSFNGGRVGMMVGVREQPYGHAAFDSLEVSR